MKPLSPCVESVVHRLPEEATSWDIAKKLFEMHPEYTHGMMSEYITRVDESFSGRSKNTGNWLEAISEHYPRETLLHGRLVILGLYELDPSLHQVLPEEGMTIIQKETTFD